MFRTASALNASARFFYEAREASKVSTPAW
jgi:hypothetical protein